MLFYLCVRVGLFRWQRMCLVAIACTVCCEFLVFCDIEFDVLGCTHACVCVFVLQGEVRCIVDVVFCC